MTVIKSTLPKNSLLNKAGCAFDYCDSFQGSVIDRENKIKLIDAGRAFFLSAPKWIYKLMWFRDKIVSLFGLKTSVTLGNRRRILDDFKWERNEKIGVFRIFDRTEDELIVGEDDRHLNFRVSLFLEKPVADEAERRITISTIVIFNNWFGRLYFFPVRPFHRLIVPSMLKAMINELEKQSCYPGRE